MIGHILKRNCLLHGTTQGHMTEVKGLGRRTQLLDDLSIRRRYWELKEEDGNDSLSIELKEGIRIFRKSMDLLINSILNN